MASTPTARSGARTSLEQFLHGEGKGAFFLFPPSPGQRQPRRGLLFSAPAAELVCSGSGDIPRFFHQVERELRRGAWLAGYFTYEMGYAFEPVGSPPVRPRSPLAWLGVFPKSQSIPFALFSELLKSRNRSSPWADYWLQPLRAGISRARYQQNLKKIQAYIAAGDTYQVNYTFPLMTRLAGDSGSLFLDLFQSQPVGYAGLIRGGGRTALSLSPELFFSSQDGMITAKPMKGTAARTSARDAEVRARLSRSAKNRAENIMIVDLLRNDFSKICRPHSVRVPRLFQVEPFRTLFQMTSTVTGQLKPGLAWQSIFRNIFPSGSVTGAPKIRTMQIIAGLESAGRGIYTGAAGFLAPGGQAQFNVPIRTLEIDQRTGTGRLSVGSGIVADSRPEAEWRESLVKARFLETLTRDYQLIETLRWDPANGFRDLDPHLCRLRASARAFGIPCDIGAIRSRLFRRLRSLAGSLSSWLRVRILLDHLGHDQVEFYHPSRGEKEDVPRVSLSRKSVNSQNLFLYHKTTNRAWYERELARTRQRGCVDVLFTNERGELTEGTIHNVYLRLGGSWVTPPLSAGLLPGIAREKLLRCRDLKIKEKTLLPKDLYRAAEIRLSNSVRGWYTARLDGRT